MDWFLRDEEANPLQDHWLGTLSSLAFVFERVAYYLLYGVYFSIWTLVYWILSDDDVVAMCIHNSYFDVFFKASGWCNNYWIRRLARYRSLLSLVRYSAGKTLFKVSEITLKQRPDGLCSSDILLTLRRFFDGWDCPIRTFVWECSRL